MRGASQAIGWELSRHHRLGLTVLGAYVVGLWAIRTLVLGPEATVRFDPPNGLAGLIIAPLTIAFFFLVAMFSYGLSGDLAARESTFPRRMFTLPVRTLTLVAWPMLYGTAASIVLWIVAVLLIHASGGVKGEIPTIWPGLAVAAFLAWMQAVTWLAYPLRAMRIVVAILALVASDLTVVVAIELHAAEATMIAILAPQIVVAYLLGYFAVSRARHAEVPDWGRFAPAASQGKSKAFSSAARAQLWLEWRMHGRSLPAMVLFVVPCELALLFLPGNDRAGMVFFILFVVLVTPPFLAMMAAPALSTFSTHGATRPLTNLRLVAAKLEMTMWSTAAAWTLTAVLTVAFLEMAAAMPVVVEKLADFVELSGMARATLVSLLVVATLVLSTWKNLVQSLCIGLTGRPWIVKSSVLAALVLACLAFPLLWAIVRKESVQAFVWDYLPWMLVALVWLKVSAAMAVAIRLHDRGVLSGRAIVGFVLAWLAAVALLYALLAWIAASPVFPFYFLASIAILLVPLARLGAAPLALAESRHR